jgi:hypothetical protein
MLHDVIYIYENAEAGTAYHEVFEAGKCLQVPLINKQL